MGVTYREWRFRTSRSAERRNVERGLVSSAVDEAVGPALRNDLVLGPEAKAFHAVLADVAETRALPAAEAVVADRHRDWHVDADHPDIDAGGEFAGRVAITGEDRDAVAVGVLRREADGFLEVPGADHLQHRAEDLVLVRLHTGLHMIEEGRADEEAFLMALQREAAAVDDQLRAFVDRQLDVAFDPLLVRLADYGAVVRFGVGGDAHAKSLDRGDELLAQPVSSLIAHRDDDRKCHAALAG